MKTLLSLTIFSLCFGLSCLFQQSPAPAIDETEALQKENKYRFYIENTPTCSPLDFGVVDTNYRKWCHNAIETVPATTLAERRAEGLIRSYRTAEDLPAHCDAATEDFAYTLPDVSAAEVFPREPIGTYWLCMGSGEWKSLSPK